MSLTLPRLSLLLSLTIAPVLATGPSAVAGSQPAVCPRSQLALEWQIKLKPVPGSQTVTAEQLQQTQAILQQRINALELDGRPIPESIVKSVGSDRIVIQLPPVNLENTAKVLFSPNQLEFRQQKPGQQRQVQALLGERRSLFDQKRWLQQSGKLDRNKAEVLRKAQVRNNQQLLALYQPTELTGTYIRRVEVDQQSAVPASPSITFDDRGSVLIAQLTKQAAQREDTIGIVLDQDLISAPTVANAYAKTGITGGRVVISGSMTHQEAQDLANRFSASRFPLPVPVEIVAQTRMKLKPCQGKDLNQPLKP